MRPQVQFLDVPLRDRIIAESRDVLSQIGIAIHHAQAVSMLADHGCTVDPATSRVTLPGDVVDRALHTAPRSLALYDARGEQTHDLGGRNVHFTPGSSALNYLEHGAATVRRPTTNDYIRYARLVSRLDHIAAQSTAMVPGDVHEQIADAYRLYLSLITGDKPVVTGAFSAEAFAVMRDMLVAVRGSADALAAKPLAIFSCCATAPLTWSEIPTQNVLDCAAHGIPIELISMPLAGFVSPVTLVGSLIEHTAELLCGVVIAQLAAPGTPLLFGGSPAIFDMRCETTPMGAVESMMLPSAYAEIGRHLGLPTQAYIALSDSKLLDAQAGLETSMGATLGGLAGINSISGPGMMDFENCFSLEKLVVDHEICAMVLRMLRGIEPKDDFPSIPLFEELLAARHLIIANHTRKHLRTEHVFPGPVIDRTSRKAWQEEGATTLAERAHAEVCRHLAAYEPPALSRDTELALTDRMTAEARRFGTDRLPDRTP